MLFHHIHYKIIMSIIVNYKCDNEYIQYFAFCLQLTLIKYGLQERYSELQTVNQTKKIEFRFPTSHQGI